MAQIFKPSANTVIRTVLFLVATGPGILGYLLSAYSRSPYNTKVGVPMDQPIPFSHRHHAYELGIDCRNCHTSVEKSSFAGLPSTETCMQCHSQIWTNSPLLEPLRKSYETGVPLKWKVVNRVPDFVYFNHSIHVNRGINCNQCHGPVQQMHMTWKGNSFEMIWCLNCHREPEKFLYQDDSRPGLTPREQVFNLYMKYQQGLPLSDRERSLILGRNYNPSSEEIFKGKELVKERGVQKDQLADCSVCHY